MQRAAHTGAVSLFIIQLVGGGRRRKEGRKEQSDCERDVRFWNGYKEARERAALKMPRFAHASRIPWLFSKLSSSFPYVSRRCAARWSRFSFPSFLPPPPLPRPRGSIGRAEWERNSSARQVMEEKNLAKQTSPWSCRVRSLSEIPFRSCKVSYR